MCLCYANAFGKSYENCLTKHKNMKHFRFDYLFGLQKIAAYFALCHVLMMMIMIDVDPDGDDAAICSHKNELSASMPLMVFFFECLLNINKLKYTAWTISVQRNLIRLQPILAESEIHS